jgi:hypothetical protein
MIQRLFPALFLFVVTLLSSCEIIGGIFKAGYYVGIFVVLAVIILIVGLFYYIGKR